MSEDELRKDPPTGLKNSTDYDLPQGWGQMSAEQKHLWFVRERAFRQASTQDTSFGQRYHEQVKEQEGIPLHEAWKRAKHGGYRFDE